MYISSSFMVIGMAAILMAVAGALLTSGGLDWYATIKKPSWTPPSWVISLAWTVIFILSAFGASMIWEAVPHDFYCCIFIILFIVNTFLNVFWSFLFFRLHRMGSAAIEAGCLTIDVVLIIILAWPLSIHAALMFVPYALWVGFAAYLTFHIAKMNEKNR